MDRFTQFWASLCEEVKSITLRCRLRGPEGDEYGLAQGGSFVEVVLEVEFDELEVKNGLG